MSNLNTNLNTIYDSIAKEQIKDMIVEGEKENDIERKLHFTVLNKYYDSQYKRKQYSKNIEESIEFVNELAFNETNKVLERTYISKTYFRMFFDLEGNFDEGLLDKFILDFKKFVLEEYHMTCEESITKNNYSIHGKSSFHVYFNIYTRLDFMPFIVNLFDIKTKYEYEKMIDKCVYRYGRLFRCPFTIRPQSKSKVPGDLMDTLNKSDFHEIIKGKLEDCLIGNICGCQKIIPSFISCITSFRNDVKLSGGNDEKEVEKASKDEDIPEENKEIMKTLEEIKNEFNKLSQLFK